MPNSEDKCMRNLLPALGALLGLIFSLSGGIWCTLATLSPNPDFQVNGVKPQWMTLVPDIQYGLFSQRDVEILGTAVNGDTLTVYTGSVCVAYPAGTTRDSNWNAAYGLQIASLVLTGLTTLVLLGSLCGLPLSNGAMKVCGATLIIAGVLFQGLVFLFYQSNVCSNNPDLAIRSLQALGVYKTSCGLGPSGILVIVAIIVFFLTGLGCCAVSSKSSDDAEGVGEGAASNVKAGGGIEAGA